MWESKARGLFTEKLVTAEQLKGKDFLFAKWHAIKFTKNVQTAHDAGVACMLFYDADPEPYLDWNLANIDKWDEWGCEDFVNIINAVMVGGMNGVPRKVFGVMVNCSKVSLPGGKKITAQWISEYGEWLMGKVYAYLKLPVYLYMDQNPIKAWKHDPVSIETLYGFIARWEGVSTVDFWVSVEGNGYPPEDAKPLLTYDDGQPWLFWFYHVDEDGNIDVMHQYDAATLNGVLGFTPAATGDPSAGSGDGDSGDSGDSTVYSSELEYLAAILAKLNDIDGRLKGSSLLDL